MCILRGFGRFVRILEDSLFSMGNQIRLWASSKFYFFKPMGLLDSVVWICFLNILTELTVQCIMFIYTQSFSKLLVHFVLVVKFMTRKNEKCKNEVFFRVSVVRSWKLVKSTRLLYLVPITNLPLPPTPTKLKFLYFHT
jgi:hypothetical protein